MRHAPTLTFVPDALPETARHLDEVLARAKALGRGGRGAGAGAAYAGEADPYKKPREADDEDDRRGRRRRSDATESGLVVVDKPGGMTSHDVVARVRRLAGTRKVGHAGTLDPMATGVLVLGVDRATRLLGHLMLTEKAYDATVRLGVATTTDDAEGEVVATASTAGARRGGGRAAALAAFVGDIEQVPSAVSAIKVDGKRAYAAGARRARTVELAARPVTVHELVVHDVRVRRRRARRRRLACAAPAAPTSGRSPATSAPRSASAAT